MVRRGYYSHEMMVVLVTRSKRIPGANIIIPQIKEALPEVTSIIQNINQDKTNVILGDVNHVLWGNKVIMILCLIRLLRLDQIHSIKLIHKQPKCCMLAADKVELTGNETVIDAYSGIGTISLTIADKVKSVLGVEVVPAAIDDAKRNADVNNVHNVKFELGKAEEKMVAWQQDGLQPDVIFCDPPRKD